MNPTWSSSYWSTETPFNNRHVVSLLIALIILWILLRLPIEQGFTFESDEKTIAIELITASTPVNTQNPPKDNTVKTTEQNPPKSEKVTESATQKPPLVKPILNQPSTTEQPIVKPVQRPQKSIVVNKAPVLPNAGDILNSMNNKQLLQPLDKDFQAKTESDNAFTFKQTIAPEAEQMNIPNQQLSKDLAVKEYVPQPMRVLKGVAGFLSFIPMDDKEKTVDDMAFCITLGRKSHHCPTSNPLAD